MLILNNNFRLPYQKSNNMCFMIQNTNDMVGISKTVNIVLCESILLDGIQNLVLITTILLLIRNIPNNNTPKQIIKLTDPIIKLSKKIIDFDNYYFQVGMSSALLIYISAIAGVGAMEPKIKLYCNHTVTK